MLFEGRFDACGLSDWALFKWVLWGSLGMLSRFLYYRLFLGVFSSVVALTGAVFSVEGDCQAQSEVAAAPAACGVCYTDGALRVLEKPSLQGERKLCASQDLLAKALLEKCHFLKLEEFYGVPQGSSALIELDTKTHYVAHLLRDRYYGEFIDRTLTDVGGSQRDLSLLLDSEPAANLKDPLALTYYYLIEEYEWSPLRVVGFTRKYQRVRLTEEGKTLPLGTTVEVKGARHLATIAVIDDPPAATSLEAAADKSGAPISLAQQQVEISLYYEDPLLTTPRFFRSFPLLSDKQRTVLQFVSDEQGNYRSALLRVHRGEVQYGEIRVRKPSEEEITLSVKLR